MTRLCLRSVHERWRVTATRRGTDLLPAGAAARRAKGWLMDLHMGRRRAARRATDTRSPGAGEETPTHAPARPP